MISELYADAGHEPAALLGHQRSIHAAAVVTGVEQIVDVQAETEFAEGIIGPKINDGPGRHVFLSIVLVKQFD